ncbi:neutral cholesterol ester hydrolase 1-like isoform X1 [Epinephelus fuscoguttatus]|uniref:neutral cholesterol ester hydrolase 1-like n=1 Tax=Epinephelus lanceolatus TaxID=310571 RepID=UPI001445A056|nr:neutral cholesterol ester hydrolase 1-like [Epinephelus lanceolatus]XP_049421364.1 neutral cholesterol ester hydrolase 1-like isoform X1 [Epinephelus fuscoguttatus]
MRLRLAGAVLLSAAAYYVYLPLPSGVSEPWKLMLLDALFRSFMQASDVAHALGVCHRVHLLNRVVSWVEEIEAHSCPAVHVTDSSLGGVPTRVFQPKGGKQLKRGVIYFHGGGWALGSGRMRSYDLLCRKMAKDLDSVIMSVDYRLAPEAVFPDQYHDALAAARAFLSAQVLEHYSIDPERVCVSGDSAGGNLAAAVAQELSSDDSLTPKFKLQALIYPVLQALDFYTPSYQQNRAVPILYRPVMARFWLQYLGADTSLEPLLLANNHSSLDQTAISASIRSKLDWTALLPAERRKNFTPVVKETGSPGVMGEVPELVDVRAAPLLAEQGVLRRTPKAYVMTCEFDVLRDDGLMYVRRLQNAGVTVTSDHYEDGFHGCMVFAFLPMMSSVGQRSMNNYIHWLDQNL